MISKAFILISSKKLTKKIIGKLKKKFLGVSMEATCSGSHCILNARKTSKQPTIDRASGSV